jgi:hypothetical protein
MSSHEAVNSGGASEFFTERYVLMIRLGGAQVTPWTLIYFIILLVILFWVAGRVRGMLVDRVLAKISRV